ncbi:MAG: helix-turn-helix transcriptional regulator [Acetobacteraceae bacterium]|nr:helix-turn-helix transcriptional regulator [Acetobacteraceae bacterium]
MAVDPGQFTLAAAEGSALDAGLIERLSGCDRALFNLAVTIEVGALAKIAGHSPFHFTRIFARSVGMTPYRYVVHLRLRRAFELLRDRRHGLADSAAATGFADQSHLSRWVRRVHGVSPTELTAR